MASLFDMKDHDLRGQILRLEEQIEDLAEVIERCRKITLISKAVIAVGAMFILAMVLGAIRVDPIVMVGAITAIIGGTVVFGSNTSTLEQTIAAMGEAQAQRAELINRIDIQVIGGRKAES